MGLVEVSGRMVSEKKDPLIRETIFGSYRIILSGRRDQQGRCDSSHLAQRPHRLSFCTVMAFVMQYPFIGS